VRNGSWAAGGDTRKRNAVTIGLTWGARVLDLLAVFLDHGRDLVVVVVYDELEDSFRAGRHTATVFATDALISIDDDEEITGTVFVAVVRFQTRPPPSAWRLRLR